MLIINAKLLTMENDVIENGFLRTQGDVIAALGEMGACPEVQDGEEVLDACGGYVLPGLVDAHTHLGICEDSLGFEGEDANEETDPATPHLRALDAINPFDRYFEEARSAGVTTVAVGPGSANPVAGQIVAIKTFGRRIDDMIVRSPIAMKMALGENPKCCYHEKNQAPMTRMATAAVIREQLFKAKEYLRAIEEAHSDEDADEPDFDMKCDALVPVLKREIPVHFHCHRADDMFTAMRIAKEFEIDYVLVHGTEGHLVADILAKEGARVICGPSLGFRSKPELRNLTFETPGALARAGVEVAITTDHPETTLDYFMFCAAQAVRAGMEEGAALRAVTITPARLLGLDEKIGSLRQGKCADIVVYTGHPFAHDTHVSCVLINGERVK